MAQKPNSDHGFFRAEVSILSHYRPPNDNNHSPPFDILLVCTPFLFAFAPTVSPARTNSFPASPVTSKMSAKVENKKFGKGERAVPHHSEKAQKWYAAEDENKDRKVRSTKIRFPNFGGGGGRYGRQQCWIWNLVGPARIAREPSNWQRSHPQRTPHTHTNRNSMQNFRDRQIERRTTPDRDATNASGLTTITHQIVGVEMEPEMGDATRSSHRAVN